jgi:hypothetical protein
MSKMSEKMYGSSPKMERDAEDGKVKVKKKSGKVDEANDEAEDQGDGEAVPMESRHAMDRLTMHHKHEHEHHAHKGGSKKEMHARHMAEHEAMMKRHEKEMKEKTPEMGKD